MKSQRTPVSKSPCSGRKAQNIMESVPQRKHVLSEFQRNEFNLWAAESEDLVQVPGAETLERDVCFMCNKSPSCRGLSCLLRLCCPFMNLKGAWGIFFPPFTHALRSNVCKSYGMGWGCSSAVKSACLACRETLHWIHSN